MRKLINPYCLQQVHRSFLPENRAEINITIPHIGTATALHRHRVSGSLAEAQQHAAISVGLRMHRSG